MIEHYSNWLQKFKMIMIECQALQTVATSSGKLLKDMKIG